MTWCPDIAKKIGENGTQHKTLKSIIVHTVALDILKQQSEIRKKDFVVVFGTVLALVCQEFLSGLLPTVKRGDERLSRLTVLTKWLENVCYPKNSSFSGNIDTSSNMTEDI